MKEMLVDIHARLVKSSRFYPAVQGVKKALNQYHP